MNKEKGISAEHQRRREKKLNAKSQLKNFLVQNVQPKEGE
jgi:hypothetical protein